MPFLPLTAVITELLTLKFFMTTTGPQKLMFAGDPRNPFFFHFTSAFVERMEIIFIN